MQSLESKDDFTSPSSETIDDNPEELSELAKSCIEKAVPAIRESIQKGWKKGKIRIDDKNYTCFAEYLLMNHLLGKELRYAMAYLSAIESYFKSEKLAGELAISSSSSLDKDHLMAEYNRLSAAYNVARIRWERAWDEADSKCITYPEEPSKPPRLIELEKLLDITI